MAYWRTYYHAVWSTKQRDPTIQPEFEADLFAAMVAAARRLGCFVHAVGGTADRVHAVLSVPPTVAPAAVIGQMKGTSAHLANRHGSSVGTFAWEEGYGLFTLGPRQLSRAVDYVRGQKQHHALQTTSAALERTADD